jgi:hypothetical protein
MKKLKLIYIPVLALSLSTIVNAKDCLQVFEKYGDNKSYQDAFCKIKIAADSSSASTSREILFTDSGLIQVFANFPGAKNSTSTGAHVFYLFPTREDKKISSADESHLSVTHPSGVSFVFDKFGHISSPDLQMKVSNEITPNNKAGIEIDGYSKGIVIDLGYRVGNTPTLNKSAVVTVTDKNKKKCTLENSEFNKIENGEASLIYKTNESLHGFLRKKCPNLDVSDLLVPIATNLKTISKPSSLGDSPSLAQDLKTVDKKEKKLNYDSVYDVAPTPEVFEATSK